jgi:nucleoside-diphosphate-sugar epimerase
VETGLNLVDVRECARGHVAALETGKSGERYILGGENLTLKQILDKLGAIAGLPSPKVKLPYFVAYVAGAVDRDDFRPHAWPRAACDHRNGSHGKEKNVGEFRQSRARIGLENSASRSCLCAARSSGSGPTAMPKRVRAEQRSAG